MREPEKGLLLLLLGSGLANMEPAVEGTPPKAVVVLALRPREPLLRRAALAPATVAGRPARDGSSMYSATEVGEPVLWVTGMAVG